MKNKSDSELRYYIENKEKYWGEEVLEAQKELERREQAKLKSEHIDSVEIESVEEDGFPQKPTEEIRKQSIYRSLISMGIFIGAFYLIFNWELIYIIVLTVVILIHEIGHYLAMRIFNYKDLGIFFVPLVGAYASGTKENISQKQNIIILLSGPLPGIIIGLILYYIGIQDKNEFLLRTSNIFILINLFNLLPIMPLDGGRVLKSLFFENNEIVSKIFIIISIAVVSYYCIDSQSYFLLIIPFFLLMQLVAQSQVKKVKKSIEEKGLSLDKSFSELTNNEYWLIRDEIGIHIKQLQRYITPKRYIVSENENKIINEIKAIVNKRSLNDLNISEKILITALWVLSFIVPLAIIGLNYIR